MITSPNCPTCNASSSVEFGSRVYSRHAIDTATGWKQTALRILFDVWQPGEETSKFTFLGCSRCGLMYYRPRPTDNEIAAKYAFIGGMGDATPSKAEPPERTAMRARRVFNILRPHIPPSAVRVLDYGGGDGRLLKNFVDAGYECGLVDYADRPIPGVVKLANTESDLPKDTCYDVMVCSHVIEHLGSPRVCLERLKEALSDNGVMYIEVPYEVFDQLPAKAEPVTHVNFFTPASLRLLLAEAGLQTIKCGISSYPHPKGHTSICVGAVARRSATPMVMYPAGLSELKRAIRPSRTRRLAMRIYRKVIPWVDTFRHGD